MDCKLKKKVMAKKNNPVFIKNVLGIHCNYITKILILWKFIGDFCGIAKTHYLPVSLSRFHEKNY